MTYALDRQNMYKMYSCTLNPDLDHGFRGFQKLYIYFGTCLLDIGRSSYRQTSNLAT